MNKSARKQYEELQQQSEKLREVEKENYKKQFDLSQKINKLIESVILEEKILSKCTWIINSHPDDDDFTLECDKRSSDIKDLSGLAETNYHCRYSFSDAELRFDDGRISLRIKKAAVAAFVKENEIRFFGVR